MKKASFWVFGLIVVGFSVFYFMLDGTLDWPKMSFQEFFSEDRSPSGKTSKLIVLGAAKDAEQTSLPSQVLVVNGTPYFIDCGESWSNSMVKAKAKNPEALNLKNYKTMFITRLDEEATIGLPFFVLTSKQNGIDKKIYGPQGISLMTAHINSAWKVDRPKSFKGFIHQKPSGITVEGVDLDPALGDSPGIIFEDDNITVEAFEVQKGFSPYDISYAYRFTTKPDHRVIAFSGTDKKGEGLFRAAKDADLLVTGVSLDDARQIRKESGVERVVLVQDTHKEPSNNIYSAKEGDIY